MPAPVEYVRMLADVREAARHPLHRRRDPDRLRPHRQAVRLGALRPRTRPDRHRQVAGRRPAARRGHRPRRRHGGAPSRRARRHLRRKSARLRRGARGDRRDGGREDPGARGRAPEAESRRGSRHGSRSIPASATSAGSAPWSAMELVTDRESKAPDKALTTRLLAAALERGLILLSSGTFGNTIRVLAPLTADDAVIDEGLDVTRRGARSAWPAARPPWHDGTVVTLDRGRLRRRSRGRGAPLRVDAIRARAPSPSGPQVAPRRRADALDVALGRRVPGLRRAARRAPT